MEGSRNLPGDAHRPRPDFHLRDSRPADQYDFSLSEVNNDSLRNIENVHAYVNAHNTFKAMPATGLATLSHFLSSALAAHLGSALSIRDNFQTSASDCGYLCCVEPYFYPLEVEEEALRRREHAASSLRRRVAAELANYNFNDRYFPVLLNIMTEDHARFVSKSILNSILIADAADFAGDVARGTDDCAECEINASLDKYCRDISINEQQMTQPEKPIVCAILRRPIVTVMPLRSRDRVRVGHTRSSSVFQYFFVMKEMIDSDDDDVFSAEFRAQTPIYLVYAASGGRGAPNHYVNLVYDQVQDDNGDEEGVSDISEEAREGVDEGDEGSEGNAGGDEGSEGEAGGEEDTGNDDDVVVSEQGGPLTRAPVTFPLPSAAQLNSLDATNVSSYVHDSSRRVQVKMYMERSNAGKSITFRCCHSNAYIKRLKAAGETAAKRRKKEQNEFTQVSPSVITHVGRGRELLDESEECKAVIVFCSRSTMAEGAEEENAKIVSSPSKGRADQRSAAHDSNRLTEGTMYGIDAEKSVMLHTCPAILSKVGCKRKVLVRLAMQATSDTPPSSNIALKRLFPQYKVNDSMATNVRREMIRNVFGTMEENFASLPLLFGAYQNEEPRCYTNLVTNEVHHFQSCVYVPSFASVVWQHGLGLMSIDACHSRYPGGGMFLIATALSSSNRYLPLAIAYTASNETTEAWDTFLAALVASGVNDRPDAVIISDRRESLATALNARYPLVDKVACSRHIGLNAKNYAKIYVQSLDSIISDMAKAGTRSSFDERWNSYRASMKADFHSALDRFYGYLVDPRQFNEDWALCRRSIRRVPPPADDFNADQYGACRFGVVTSNASETINGVFRDFRSYPIAAALSNMIKYLYRKYDEAQRSFNIDCVRTFGGDWRALLETVLAHEVAPGDFRRQLEAEQRLVDTVPMTCNETTSPLADNGNVRRWVVARTGARQADGGVQLQHRVERDGSLPLGLRWDCTCLFTEHVGVPCRHILYVISKAVVDGGPRAASRPEFSYQEAVHPRLQMHTSYRSLQVDVSLPLSVSTHSLGKSQRMVLAHAPVARPGPAKASKSTRSVRIPNRGEKRKNKCTTCGQRAGHNSATCPQAAKQKK